VKKRQALSLAMNMSWTMLFSLLLPLLAGVWLDKKLGTVPLFILIGAILGISAATIGVARMTIRTFAKTTQAYDAVKEAAPPDDPGISGPETGWDQQAEDNHKEGPS
jgi:F0F1-type ATP synthase assembly protein I